ncbi:ParB/RepB/Spo0J family partition protein [Erysipelothrix aquatica]|uniref:ParB/RepB/Spo0J family partition protein n=1 Tax=Erysipelothrix aquatica TaxID=2683714 RepID=UPI001F40FFB0|nr:ParB/RepB/Spo0J family partition protein [Erysipelothrix aquatica]
MSELVDSIKSQGVLQNLTVVPGDDEMYTVIIGHRILDASKLAGLVELPCMVVGMDEKTQLMTMLVENIQRQDLTPLEQAKGLQQCLGLRMSDEEIRVKTGFSKRKIREKGNPEVKK